MSITLATAKSRVRLHLRDRNPSDYIFSSPELDREIEAVMRTLAPEAKLGTTVTTLALTSATDTFSMPGSAQYAQVISLRRQSDGLTLEGPLTREQFDLWREGQTSSNVSKATPQRYTLYEDTSQALKVQFHPWPDTAYTLDVICSTLPAALTTDASTIPFDDPLAEALCYEAAANLADKAPDELLAKIELARDASRVFRAAAARLRKSHRIRRANLRAAVRVARNVR